MSALPISSVLYAGQSALTIWSGYQQAAMMRSQGRINQNIADFNAKFLDRDAKRAEEYGFTAAARYQTVIDSTAADARLAYASTGVDVNYGSAAEVQEETKLTGVLNQLDIIQQGYDKARGLRQEARNVRFGGFLQRKQTDIQAAGVERQGILDVINPGMKAGAPYIESYIKSQYASGYGG